MDKFLRNRSTLNPGRGEFLPTLTFAPLPFFHFFVSDGKHPRREHLETILKRFASRLNFQFDSINTRLESRFWKYPMEIYILQLLRAKAREHKDRLQSRHVSKHCIAIQFRQPRIRIIIVFAWQNSVYAILPHHVSRVTEREEGILGKRARPTEIQTRGGRSNKGGEDGKDDSAYISNTDARRRRQRTRIRGEIRGIPNPVTSWTDMVDDSLTDPSGFNHYETNTRQRTPGPG